MMKVGSVWASMRLKSVASESIMALDHLGQSYPTGESGPNTYVMECKCGAEIRVPVHEFPGKWNIRYCGDEGCAFSPEHLKQARRAAIDLERKKITGTKRMGRPSSGDPSVNLTISMPSSVFIRVRGAAMEVGRSMSQQITELVCKGCCRGEDGFAVSVVQ